MLHPSPPSAPSFTPPRRGRWLAIGWGLILVVVWLSLTPQPSPVVAGHSDKLGHVVAYFLLTAWFARVQSQRWRVALATFALGAILEGLQGLTGYRDMSALDQVANSVGIGLGWLSATRAPLLWCRLQGWLA